MNTLQTEIGEDGRAIIIETNKRILTKAELHEEIQRIYYRKDSLVSQSKAIAAEYDNLLKTEEYLKGLLDSMNDNVQDGIIVLK